jgi:hypothetical protein
MVIKSTGHIFYTKPQNTNSSAQTNYFLAKQVKSSAKQAKSDEILLSKSFYVRKISQDI